MSGSLDFSHAEVVDRLVALYDHSFGGKPRGRYRISMKLMRRMLNQRRLWPEQIEAIRRGLYETGYILIDLETYFVVVSQRTFANYRRLNEGSIVSLGSAVGEDSVDASDDDELDDRAWQASASSVSDEFSDKDQDASDD